VKDDARFMEYMTVAWDYEANDYVYAALAENEENQASMAENEEPETTTTHMEPVMEEGTWVPLGQYEPPAAQDVDFPMTREALEAFYLSLDEETENEGSPGAASSGM